MPRGFLLVLVTAVAALFAQSPQMGSVAGVVRDAGAGSPLAGVRVSLGASQAVTDSQGRFRFDAVAPGAHRLSAVDKGRFSSGLSVTVRAGEEASAEMRLKLAATISGRVLDSSGNPVANAVVMLLERRYRYGDLVYSPGQTTSTNADGEYRLAGVPPGRSLRLLVKNLLTIAAVGELPPYGRRQAVPSPELYPESLTLSPGEVRERVDLRMPSSPAYCIEGSFDTHGATQSFVSFSEGLSLDRGWVLTPALIRASADGSFQACGLHRGAYRIVATSKPPGANLSERFAAEAATLAAGEALIADRDLRGLKLAPAAAAAIIGDASFDPSPRGKAPKLQLTLTRSVNGGEAYGDATSQSTSFGTFSVGGAATDVPGPFSLGRHLPGDWDLRVLHLPAGCYIKEAAYGSQDLTRAPLRIGEDGAAGRVRLVLGCDAGSLSARVTDKDGNPVAGGAIYLFSADAGSPGTLAATLRRGDIAGGWSAPVTDLRPGKYLIIATDLDINPRLASADEIDELWSSRGKATEVEIGPGAMVQLSLPCNRAPSR